MQRYVSNELTHFVGSGSDDEDEQYEILLSILISGYLSPHGKESDFSMSSTVGGDSVCVSENDLYAPGVVCFCDIPTGELGIHIKKYSRFGVAFGKTYLVDRGANPVFYVARQSRARQTLTDDSTRAEFFDRIVSDYQSFLHYEGNISFMDGHERTARFRRLFELYILGFVKFFDAGLRDDDPENFYMEREWRAIAPVRFNLVDVERIILPRSFASRLRKDCPDYFGQVTFSDAVES